jgi:hypothetical protein
MATTAHASPIVTVPDCTDQTDDIVLRSIATKESNMDPNAVGRLHGELSMFQFTATTWSRLSRLPFAAARTNPAEAYRVAKVFLADIRANLRDRGMSDGAFNIAVEWNAGLHWRRIPASTREYARCVANIAETLTPRAAFPYKFDSAQVAMIGDR